MKTNGRIIPDPKYTDVSIECNRYYCRTRDHTIESKICWKCRSDEEDFVKVDANSWEKLVCNEQNVEEQDLFALESQDKLL